MKNMTYEKAISRLEEIVSKLEGNEIPLEDSIALFQEGIELSKYCDDKLKNCLLYTSPSPRDSTSSRMPSSA